MEDRIFKIFQSVINCPENMPKSQIVFNEVPGWDSVAHMALIAALEDNFECMLEMDEIIDLSSLEKAIVIMEKYA